MESKNRRTNKASRLQIEHLRRFSPTQVDTGSSMNCKRIKFLGSNKLEQNHARLRVPNSSTNRLFFNQYCQQTRSRDTWNRTEICLLISFVGYFANRVPAETNTIVKLSEIPWNEVSRNMVSRPLNVTRTKYSDVLPKSALQCKEKWQRLFPDFELLRKITGVLLTSKVLESPPQYSSQHSNGSEIENKSQEKSSRSKSNSVKSQLLPDHKSSPIIGNNLNILGKRKAHPIHYQETLHRFKSFSALGKRILNMLYYRYGDNWNKIAYELGISAEEVRYHLQYM